MANPAFDYITPGDYLAFEIKAAEKHEYFDGRIYAMAGATIDHNYIATTLSRKIGNFLEDKSCDIFGTDLRITSPGFNSFIYPDLTIVCGPIIKKESGFDTVTNPSVIIEVLSASTRGYDLAFKFHYYQQIPSLKEYIVVDSTRPFVLVNKKQGNDWVRAEINDINSSFFIETIEFELPLKEVYRKVSYAD